MQSRAGRQRTSTYDAARLRTSREALFRDCPRIGTKEHECRSPVPGSLPGWIDLRLVEGVSVSPQNLNVGVRGWRPERQWLTKPLSVCPY